MLVAVPAAVIPLAVLAAVSSRRNGLPADALVIALTLVIGFMIPTVMQLGLRNDLDHVDVIKSLPIGPQMIVWGSIGASILYITLVQALALLATLAVLRQWVPSAAVALALALPINVLTVSVDSALVLLFPSIRRFTPGDLLVGVRMVIVNFVKVLFAAVAAGLAGLVFIAFKVLFSDLPTLPFVVSWIVLICEGLLTVWVVALLFKDYDPSEHAIDGE
jgi:hypothetical protein